MRVPNPEWIAPALTVVGVAAIGSIVVLALGAARRRSRAASSQETQEARIERLEKMLIRLDERLIRLEGPPAANGPASSTIDMKPMPAPDPLRRSVYALADRGHEPIEIARQLDEQVGKVELILALRESKADS